MVTDPSHDPIQPNFRRIAPFSDLSADTLVPLTAMSQQLVFQAGEVIAAAGDKPPFVGFVLSGILRMEKIFPNGSRHIVGLLMSGDMFGRVFDGPMPFDVEAAARSRIIMFRRGPFEELVRHSPELDRLVIHEILNEIDQARNWMIILGYPRIQTRVCGFLVLLCTRYRNVAGVVQERDNSLTVQIPIARQDMAHLLGTRTESISRALHSLQKAGHIRIIRPDVISIIDFEALMEETGDEHRFDVSEYTQANRGKDRSVE